jgi:hypothetical protein
MQLIAPSGRRRARGLAHDLGDARDAAHRDGCGLMTIGQRALSEIRIL